jgi:hypothetical protein
MPSEEQLFAHRVPRHEEGLSEPCIRFLAVALCLEGHWLAAGEQLVQNWCL